MRSTSLLEDGEGKFQDHRRHMAYVKDLSRKDYNRGFCSSARGRVITYTHPTTRDPDSSWQLLVFLRPEYPTWQPSAKPRGAMPSEQALPSPPHLPHF